MLARRAQERAPARGHAGVLALAGIVGLSACGVLSAGAQPRSATRQDIVAAAGWTRIATTEEYLLVVNVLPGEQMYTSAEIEAQRPTEGERIIDGKGLPLGPDARHVEAHIYDRGTGTPLAMIVPTITVVNRTTGETTTVLPTLMQDINIGSLDIHYGNNVTLAGNSDLSVQISVAHEEVTVDGHLD